MERIRLNRRPALWIATNGSQVIQTLEAAALAFPVADCVINEGQLAQAAKIRDREYALENTLEPGIVTFIRQQFHLQKTLVGLLLNFDQIWNWD
ncbi:MAG: hypothetical protein WKF37_19190 [Bryobacteraceae bacterium]